MNPPSREHLRKILNHPERPALIVKSVVSLWVQCLDLRVKLVSKPKQKSVQAYRILLNKLLAFLEMTSQSMDSKDIDPLIHFLKREQRAILILYNIQTQLQKIEQQMLPIDHPPTLSDQINRVKKGTKKKLKEALKKNRLKKAEAQFSHFLKQFTNYLRDEKSDFVGSTLKAIEKAYNNVLTDATKIQVGNHLSFHVFYSSLSSLIYQINLVSGQSIVDVLLPEDLLVLRQEISNLEDVVALMDAVKDYLGTRAAEPYQRQLCAIIEIEEQRILRKMESLNLHSKPSKKTSRREKINSSRRRLKGLTKSSS